MSCFYSSSWPIVQSYTEAGRKPAPCILSTSFPPSPSAQAPSQAKAGVGAIASHTASAHSALWLEQSHGPLKITQNPRVFSEWVQFMV